MLEVEHTGRHIPPSGQGITGRKNRVINMSKTKQDKAISHGPWLLLSVYVK